MKFGNKIGNKNKKNNNIILHNKYVLYVIFVIALGNLLILVDMNDYYSASIFVLIGFLTSFFSKNMIVILLIAIAFTNIIKYGSKSSIEGMKSSSKDDSTDSNDSEESKVLKESKESKKSKDESEESPLSVETNEGTNKEKFGQDKNVVYTSDEDKEIQKQEKMLISQEKLLNSMNKYKPLLDTLQGITKNMAIVKGLSKESDD